jgi:hypothetical protein
VHGLIEVPPLALQGGDLGALLARMRFRRPKKPRRRIDRALAEVAAGMSQLESTFVEPVVCATDQAEVLRNVRTLGVGFLLAMSEFMQAVAQWLEGTEAHRTEFVKAVTTPRGRPSNLAAPGARDAWECAMDCMRALPTLTDLQARARIDQGTAAGLVNYVAQSDLLAFAAVCGLDNKRLARQGMYPFVALVAREQVINRYLVTRDALLGGLPASDRNAFTASLEEAANGQVHELKNKGVELELSDQAVLYFGDGLLGDYLSKAVSLVHGAMHPEKVRMTASKEIDQIGPRITLDVYVPAAAPDEAADSMMDARKQLREALPGPVATSIGINVRLP